MTNAQILIGDVRTRLADIPDNTIQSCVTSPPYWGLRDYGTATWESGDPNCDHLGKPMATKANINKNCGTGNDVKNAEAREFYKDICGKCGARRIDSQIGLEQTPDEYVAEMVAVFREVRRVLKDDGVLWLNLGDSYCTVPHGPKAKNAPQSIGGQGSRGRGQERSGSAKHGGGHANRKPLPGLKHKDLVGIPWRVAFALQADGWWLRQDIIWHKPNPMPESVTDRCTKAHEYLFLLTKSSKYYFDNKAIKEPVAASSLARAQYGWDCDRPSTKNASMGGQGIHVEKMGTRFVNPEGRNKRSVWTIATKPFRGAHFAVMPEALVEPCILASSRRDDTVLDPFTGSGTVAVVALRHERNFIGTELNTDYVNIAKQRITDANPMFNNITIN
jgi:DNA modification methylase